MRNLWNCISFDSRIWFYLGVYVELRPVTRACIMFPVSNLYQVCETFIEVIVNGQKLELLIFFWYSIPYWTLEIQQMPFSDGSLNSFDFYFYLFYLFFIFNPMGRRKEPKKKKKKMLPTENQIMIIILQCGQTICQTVWSLVQLLFWNEVLRLLDRYNE